MATLAEFLPAPTWPRAQPLSLFPYKNMNSNLTQENFYFQSRFDQSPKLHKIAIKQLSLGRFPLLMVKQGLISLAQLLVFLENFQNPLHVMSSCAFFLAVGRVEAPVRLRGDLDKVASETSDLF